jgi:cysteine desulfurase
MTPATYLDYNASAPIRAQAAAAVGHALSITGNASSVHGFGRRARACLEDAREAVAALVQAPPAAVIFTSGGTEANNLALRGLAHGRRVLLSAGEHPSVLNALEGCVRVPLSSDGVIDLAALEALLAADPQPVLLSVMLANNETGVIQPIAAVVEMARRFSALVHCDAVQAAGKMAVDMAALGVDALSLSAHKIGGPQGVGALIADESLALAPVLLGGGQERRRRAGTENVPGIAGFAAAAHAALADLDDAPRIAALRDDLERRARAVAPAVKILGAEAPRLPNTSCLALPGWPAETQVMGLDLAGVAVSAGSACSSGKVAPSHVLRAMGADEAVAAAAIRVSLGWASTAVDVDHFIQAWGDLYARSAAGRRMHTSAA